MPRGGRMSRFPPLLAGKAGVSRFSCEPGGLTRLGWGRYKALFSGFAGYAAEERTAQKTAGGGISARFSAAGEDLLWKYYKNTLFCREMYNAAMFGTNLV